MHFELNEEQKALQKTLCQFFAENIAPKASICDEEQRFLPENFKALAEIGYFDLFFPKEYGGQGVDYVTCAMATMELSRACASTALSASASAALCGGAIALYGSEAQKRKYLPPLRRAEIIGSFGLTEPGCGSDVKGIQTRAEKQNGYFLLNGSKMFITNGSICDISVIFARTGKVEGHRGFSAFIVEKETEGFSAGKPLNKMGVRGSPTTELFLENCKLPESQLLGREGEGFYMAMEVLERGRIGMAAWCLGIGQAAFEEAVKYARERKAFGHPIAHFQGVHFKIAEMKMLLDAAELLTYKAAWKKNANLSAAEEASAAKLMASEAAMKATHFAVQIHGGYGYIKEFPVERYFRDARLGEIGEGSSEIQRLILAKSLLKEVL